MQDVELEERHEWIILGRAAGTATSWDEAGDNAIILYDFAPCEGLAIPRGDTGFDFESGLVLQHDDDGVETFRADICELFAKLPRAEGER